MWAAFPAVPAPPWSSRRDWMPMACTLWPTLWNAPAMTGPLTREATGMSAPSAILRGIRSSPPLRLLPPPRPRPHLLRPRLPPLRLRPHRPRPHLLRPRPPRLRLHRPLLLQTRQRLLRHQLRPRRRSPLPLRNLPRPLSLLRQRRTGGRPKVWKTSRFCRSARCLIQLRSLNPRNNNYSREGNLPALCV